MPMQPGPPCKGWIRPISPSHWSVRCKHCANFYSALAYIKSSNKQLHAIYEETFNKNRMNRRAFICRSHKAARNGHIRAWLQKELQAMWSEHNSFKGTKDPDAWQPTHKVLIRVSIDGPSIHHNYTTADINPVATFTQEHHHCHLVRYAIPRGITCPPM